MSTHVLVLGGGYAGVMAANRLAGRDDVTVTLVDARPRFVERVRLHQVAAGTHGGLHDWAEVLGERVRVVVGEATHVDTAHRRVGLADGTALTYDHLVYAVGSHATDGGVPGAAEHALAVSTFEAATRLRAALDAEPAVPVVVVGGGPTGIETAAELAETGRAVTLVCGGVLAPYVRPHARRAITRRLARLGVTVLEQPRAAEVRSRSVLLDDGRVLDGLTVWATGFAVPDLARRSGLTTDAAGRLLTDETLASIDDDRVVGAGDAVAPSGVPQRASCQAAVPLGARAADTVLAHLDGRVPEPVDNVFLGQCIALGRRAAIFQASRPDDTAVALHVSGRAGAALKEGVTRQIVAGLTREARRPGSTRLPSSASARARTLARADRVTSALPQARVSA
ncbi:FAD-dependent oxidoreductase [Cellulomonas fimi]|uniref:NAD(P)/FAD-dependent oxidoreductase n=1 Tax=Cellulomonas fimi TaxID=1708 RepID=UPI00234D4F9D|nr:FAD-dependent oxidoreductase [Cellulomonas fimi]MDC7120418.1 FAD-dependent oxidoreductase [Cellulomonas fimi]